MPGVVRYLLVQGNAAGTSAECRPRGNCIVHTSYEYIVHTRWVHDRFTLYTAILRQKLSLSTQLQAIPPRPKHELGSSWLK